MIIGLTGGMASGKRTIADFLLDRGFVRLTFSDILSDELKKMNIPVTRKTQQDLGNEIRSKEGSGGLAKRLIAQMQLGKNYVIDGIRNPGEVLELRKQKDFVLIYVDCPQKQRFKRIVSRGMERDPKTWKDFLIADSRDFDDGTVTGLQIAKCIAIADYVLVNDCSIEDFRRRFEDIFEKIKLEKNFR